MRRIVLSLFLIVCAASSFAQTQVAKKTSYGRGYLESVPADYSSSSTLYPCIIFLHGSGERGDGSPAQLEKVKAQGIPKFIKNGATMCFTVNGKTECFIVLSPQQTTNRSGWVGDVIPFVQYALNNYRIDPSRVYLTGLSMGGDGTWDASYTAANEPNYFAATAPVSCKGDYNGAKITASRKISVWALHGDKDTSVPPSDGKRPVNGMVSVSAIPAPIWTLIAGGTHSSSTWDKVYSPTHTYFATNLYEWFLSQKKYVQGLPPVADAGDDILITLPTNSSVITGSGTDSDGIITSYSWKQLSGPTTATTTNLSQPQITVSNCALGEYTFALTVTDNSNAISVDSTIITVISGSTNQAPVVNAGSDKMITLPNTAATLNAIASDADGSIISYQWTKTWGATTTLINANTSSLSIVATTAGTYTFKVVVTDDKGLKTSDNVNVTIKKALPVANAGTDKQLTSPVSTATLQGSGTDVDGTIISYAWTQTDGPSSAIINNLSLPVIQVSQLSTVGEYTFTLTVTDNDNQKASDLVKVIVSNMVTSQMSAGRVSGGDPSEETQVEEIFINTSLSQNYPNPFTNQTTIPFTLKSSQHVIVKVYDFYGAEIQTLVNEQLEAGEHVVQFSPAIPNQFFIIKLVADGKMFSSKAAQL